MNILDLILVIPLFIGAVSGFRKGLIREIFSILAFIIALIAGFKLLHITMNWLQQHFDLHGELLPFLAFFLIFVLVVILTNLAGKFIKKVVHMTILGIFDNLGGAILSLLKWALGISVLLWLLATFHIDLPAEWTKDSLIYPYLLQMSGILLKYIGILIPFVSDLFDSIRELTIS